MEPKPKEAYEGWLAGQVLLLLLLGAALALFVTNAELRNTYELPEARLVLDTAVAVAAGIVALLTGLRFSVEGRRLDLLLFGSFFVTAASTLAFSVAPLFGGAEEVGRVEGWAGIVAWALALTLLAAAPFDRGRSVGRRRTVLNTAGLLVIVLTVVWGLCRSLGDTLPALTEQPWQLSVALGACALLSLVAMIGFGMRYRARPRDFYRWLALAATLMLFAELHYVFTPLVSSDVVSQGDFLRLLAYGVLLVGVARAIQHAEFGRAVADERARVAREIHDGLAQYLFAISTHASMLASGAAPGSTLWQLKEAATAAQQEARFAVLALSSASGNAPFDAALRRYVEFLTADGALDVELDIDEGMLLAPDEQIEVFRIVQEGLGNVRKHARARSARVTIGRRGTERYVLVVDDGAGLNGNGSAAGQGLKNMRERAAAIGGGFQLSAAPGGGTSLEVVLRA